MKADLSPNAQAIILLTAPLRVLGGISDVRPLSSREYAALAVYLHERRMQPADLLGPDAGRIVADCPVLSDKVQAHRLLERGFLLSQAIERWRSRAIWVVTRADAAYPRRLKLRLKDSMPPVLYGCGNRELLDGGGLAVVGSRNIDEDLVRYTEQLGHFVGTAGTAIVSGGARGVDKTAMLSAIRAGGTAVGVLADTLERAALAREYREGLMSGCLTLVSPFDPGTRFTVANAMQRNKLIYGLSDAALVVSSDWKKGGTWAGAMEQLEKLHFVPVYVRSVGARQKALDAMVMSGAHWWPTTDDATALHAALSAPAESYRHQQQALPLPAAGIAEEKEHWPVRRNDYEDRGED